MRYGNLLIEGTISTPISSTDGINAENLVFELGDATVGDADGGSFTFKPGAGFGTGTGGSFNLLPFDSVAGSTTELRFNAINSTNYVAFKAADTITTDVVWTLPDADGTSNQVLSTDGAGELSWMSVPLLGYVNIAGDTGTAQADLVNDTLSFAGGVGITTVASDITDNDLLTISFSNHDMVSKPTPVLADQIVIFDSESSSSPAYTTFSNAFTTLNVVYGITANGIIARTADDTYASRTITASIVAGEEGIAITDGDGVAGNPTIGLDIDGLTDGTVEAGGEVTSIASYNGTSNVKVTPAEIVTSRIARGTFVNGDLVSGVIDIEHSLGVDNVLTQIYDEQNQMILPDTITLSDNDTVSVDITSFGTIGGTWSYIIFG